MSGAARQLPLPFPHAPHYAAADFLEAPSNLAALSWLAPGIAWPGGRLALWGEEGVGKTHLLHLWAAREAASLWHGPVLRGLPPPPPPALALDDADACADEQALLHLLNAAAEQGSRLLLAARAPPARWTVTLPDLASRLRAVTAVQIGPPEDSLLAALLARLLVERQLAMPEALQQRLRLHLPRTPASLREATARLDRAALAEGRREIGRRLLVQVLADLGGTDMTGVEQFDDVSEVQGGDASHSPALLV